MHSLLNKTAIGLVGAFLALSGFILSILSTLAFAFFPRHSLPPTLSNDKAKTGRTRPKQKKHQLPQRIPQENFLTVPKVTPMRVRSQGDTHRRRQPAVLPEISVVTSDTEDTENTPSSINDTQSPSKGISMRFTLRKSYSTSDALKASPKTPPKRMSKSPTLPVQPNRTRPYEAPYFADPPRRTSTRAGRGRTNSIKAIACKKDKSDIPPVPTRIPS